MKLDEMKGDDICAFVTLEGDFIPSDELANELKAHVSTQAKLIVY